MRHTSHKSHKYKNISWSQKLHRELDLDNDTCNIGLRGEVPERHPAVYWRKSHNCT